MIQSQYLTGNYSLGSPLMDISASGAGRARWRTRRRRDRRSSRVGDPLWIGCTEIPCFVFYAALNICSKIFSVVARTAHSSVFALCGHPSLHGVDFYRRVHQVPYLCVFVFVAASPPTQFRVDAAKLEALCKKF